MRALLRAVIPGPVRAGLRRLQGKWGSGLQAVRWHVTDWCDVRLGRRSPMVPPARMYDYVGGGDFITVGQEFLQRSVALGGLRPSDDVLDVGCGIGRLAVPLTGYLTTGRYDGLDIVPAGIAWCRRQITRRFPHFRFHLADLYNAEYRPAGQGRACEYCFPFRDASFDFAFLVSVFTHMLPADLAQYLRETARVLRPGGRSFITYFLLNEVSREAIAAGRAHRLFRHTGEGYVAEEATVHESAVAYSEQAVRRLYQECGLIVEEPIHYGSWCPREGGAASYQDIVIARKLDAVGSAEAG